MKQLFGITLVLISLQSGACPTLQGTFTCQESGSAKTMKLEMLTKTQGDQMSYKISSESFALDTTAESQASPASSCTSSSELQITENFTLPSESRDHGAKIEKITSIRSHLGSSKIHIEQSLENLSANSQRMSSLSWDCYRQ